MDQLENLPEEFLSITFDQLRTLLFVVQEGSPRKAALALNRDQSSVVKQLERLNECFQHLCGEPLAVKRGRGEDYVFTQTCDEIAVLAERLLDNWRAYLERRRREVGQRLVVATTTFTLSILAQLWDEVTTHMKHRTELQVTQIRTQKLWDSLQDRSVDLVIGGIVVEKGELPQPIDSDFAEWSREEFCVLTNLPQRLFPGELITKEELRRYPLILPTSGIIDEVVRKWYGEDYQRKLKLQPPVSDVHYAAELLFTGTVEGFMISTSTVAERLGAGLPDSGGKDTGLHHGKTADLRVIRLGAGFQPLDLVSGLLGRKGERGLYESFDKHHPLVLFWKMFERNSPAYKRLPQRK